MGRHDSGEWGCPHAPERHLETSKKNALPFLFDLLSYMTIGLNLTPPPHRGRHACTGRHYLHWGCAGLNSSCEKGLLMPLPSHMPPPLPTRGGGLDVGVLAPGGGANPNPHLKNQPRVRACSCVTHLWPSLGEHNWEGNPHIVAGGKCSTAHLPLREPQRGGAGGQGWGEAAGGRALSDSATFAGGVVTPRKQRCCATRCLLEIIGTYIVVRHICQPCVDSVG